MYIPTVKWTEAKRDVFIVQRKETIKNAFTIQRTEKRDRDGFSDSNMTTKSQKTRHFSKETANNYLPTFIFDAHCTG